MAQPAIKATSFAAATTNRLYSTGSASLGADLQSGNAEVFSYSPQHRAARAAGDNPAASNMGADSA